MIISCGLKHIAILSVIIRNNAYKLSENFAKLGDRCILCNEIVHTTIVSKFQEDHDIYITVGTRVEPPQNSRTHQLRSVGEAAISLQHWFTLFPRDGSSDYRTIPNVTLTVCNFTMLRQFLLKLWLKKSSDNLYALCIT
jgi:hypothetical protein